MGGGRNEEQIDNSQTDFRKATVLKILWIRKKKEGLSRQMQFLAVSIVDSFQSCRSLAKQKVQVAKEDANLFAASSLFIALKVDGSCNIVFQKIHSWFFEKEPKEIVLQKIVEVQSTILHTINFNLPLQTPYTYLVSYLKKNKNIIDEDSSKALKILMLSLEQWPYLSHKPEVANELCDLVVNGKGTKLAKKIYMSIRSHEKRMSPKSHH